MADDNKDDKNMGSGKPGETTVNPSASKEREPGAPWPKSADKQDKAAKKQNFKGGSDEQDTHK